jgi:hypothetical protein
MKLTNDPDSLLSLHGSRRQTGNDPRNYTNPVTRTKTKQDSDFWVDEKMMNGKWKKENSFDSQWKLLPPMTILLVLLSASCTKVPVVNQPAPTPSPSLSTSPRAEAGGGAAPKEPGDTSPEQFTGTAGILEIKRSDIPPVLLKAIRTGRHTNFDRVVFEFEGNQVPGYHIEYVDKPVRNCGPGEVVQVTGYGFLLVQMIPAQAHTDDGQATIKERDFAPNLPIIKELKVLCDFEANVQWILGLSSPNRYRALELSNPARLVIDIRH